MTTRKLNLKQNIAILDVCVMLLVAEKPDAVLCGYLTFSYLVIRPLFDWCCGVHRGVLERQRQ